MTQARYRIVARMLEKGASRERIAHELGLPMKKVISDVFRARQVGVLPEYIPITYKGPFGSIRWRLGRRKLRVGGMPEAMNQLTPETAKWLAEQVPDGATLAETIAAIITDAHHEENP